MTVQNIVIGSEKPKTRGRKPGSKNKFGGKVDVPENEAQAYFDGDNLGENAPLDELLSGKKITWHKKYLVWLTLTKKHGKVMSDKTAFSTGDHACDKFFNSAYQEGHFVVKNKKTQEIEFDEPSNFGKGFINLCNFLNSL